MVENGSLKLASVTLINQLRLFMKQGSSFKAEKGGHDDLVSAFLIVMMMLPQIANYDDNVDSLINEFSDVNESDEFWGISF